MNDSILEMHDTKDLSMKEDEYGNYIITFHKNVCFEPNETIKIWRKEEDMQNVQSSKDGIHWEPAKEVPYYPTFKEKIKCAFGFHELFESKKYVNTKVCFRCGKRIV